MARVVGAVLAAGSGSRMGSPKAQLRIDGVRLVDRAVRALADGGCADVLAVVRPGVQVVRARAVVNADPERGLRSSLALAIGATDPAADALAVVLVDMPGIGADAVRAVVAGWIPGRVAVATCDGHRSHPTVMSLELWREALELAGDDEGARVALAARPALVDEIAVDADDADLDTLEDLARWRSSGRLGEPGR